MLAQPRTKRLNFDNCNHDIVHDSTGHWRCTHATPGRPKVELQEYQDGRAWLASATAGWSKPYVKVERPPLFSELKVVGSSAPIDLDSFFKAKKRRPVLPLKSGLKGGLQEKLKEELKGGA